MEKLIILFVLLSYSVSFYACGGGGGGEGGRGDGGGGGAGNASATTYYVSPTGSDSSNGTASTPFKTIQKAANIVNPGDTVIVKDGTYTDTDVNGRIVNVTRGGSAAGGYVTFKAENKWGAVLDGQNNTADYGFVIYDSVQYVRIQDFEIKGVKNGAIFSNPLTAATATGFIDVYRNKIHDVSRRQILCDGTELIGRSAIYGNKYSHDWTIDSNIAWNIGRLQGGCPTSNEYAHDNFVYTGIGDSTSVRTYNWNIISNIVYEGDLHFAGFFVAIGSYGENINIVHNTVKGHNYNSTVYGVIYMNPELKNLNIQNNIFCDTPVGFLQNLYAGTDTGVTIYNNLTTAPNVFGYPVYSTSILSATSTLSGNILSTDPLFVSLSPPDYHLQSTSPAINKGVSIAGHDYDADGNPIVGAPDIGAYEYIGEGTQAHFQTPPL